jgi:pimeloyl-ACP methyl ester carboxylesterase
VQPASLSGVIRVRDEGPQTVSGATITVGTLTATSAQDGRFVLPALPTGSVVVRVTAPGFDPAQHTLVIQSGGNSVDISLWRANSMYETSDMVVYVPSGVTTVRGVFFLMIGLNVDNRHFVRGDLTQYPMSPAQTEAAQDYRRRLMTLARAHGLALMGSISNFTAPLPVSILQTLNDLSARGRPELADAPLMFHGNSGGACASYDFTVLHPDRVIGFIIAKAAACLGLDAAPAIAVPGYFIFGEADNVLPAAAAQMTSLFQQHRSNGAVWALAVEPGAGHDLVADHNLLFNWMEEVLTRRLPATTTPGTPVQLRVLDAGSGWLGDWTSRAIAASACYRGDKLSASWLPSEQTARDWQAMVSSGSVKTITACGP